MPRIGDDSTVSTKSAIIILLIACLVDRDAKVDCLPSVVADATSNPAVSQYQVYDNVKGTDVAPTGSDINHQEPEKPKASSPGTYSYYSFSIDGDQAKTDVQVNGPGVAYNYQVNNKTPQKPIEVKSQETDTKSTNQPNIKPGNIQQQSYAAPLNDASFNAPSYNAAGQSYNAPAAVGQSYNAPAIMSQSFNAPAPTMQSYVSPISGQSSTGSLSVQSYLAPASDQSYDNPDITKSYASSSVPNAVNQLEVPSPVTSYNEPSSQGNQQTKVQLINTQQQDKGSVYSPQNIASQPSFYLIHGQSPNVAPAPTYSGYSAMTVHDDIYQNAAAKSPGTESQSVLTTSQENYNRHPASPPFTGQPPSNNPPINSYNQNSNVPREFQNSPIQPSQDTSNQPLVSTYKNVDSPSNYQNPSSNVAPPVNLPPTVAVNQQSYTGATGVNQQNQYPNNYNNQYANPMNFAPIQQPVNPPPPNNLNQVYDAMYEEEDHGNTETDSGYHGDDGGHYPTDIHDGSEYNEDEMHHHPEAPGYPMPNIGIAHGTIIASGYDIGSSSQNHEQNVPINGANTVNRPRESRATFSNHSQPMTNKSIEQIPKNNSIPSGNTGAVKALNYVTPVLWYRPITPFAGNHVFPTPMMGNYFNPLMRFQRHQPIYQPLQNSFKRSVTPVNFTSTNYYTNQTSRIMNLTPAGGALTASPSNVIDLGTITSYQDLLTKLASHSSNRYHKTNVYSSAANIPSIPQKTYYPSTNYLQQYIRTSRSFPLTYVPTPYRPIVSSAFSSYLPTVLRHVHNRFHQLSTAKDQRNTTVNVYSNLGKLSSPSHVDTLTKSPTRIQPTYANKQPHFGTNYATRNILNYQNKQHDEKRREHNSKNMSSSAVSFESEKIMFDANKNDAKTKTRGDKNFPRSRIYLTNENGVPTVVYNSSSTKKEQNAINFRKYNQQPVNETFESNVQRLSQTADQSKRNQSVFDEYLLTSHSFITNKFSPPETEIQVPAPINSWKTIDPKENQNNAHASDAATESKNISAIAKESELNHSNFYDYKLAQSTFKPVYVPNIGRRMDHETDPSLEEEHNHDVIENFDDELIRKKRTKRRTNDSESTNSTKNEIPNENDINSSNDETATSSLVDSDDVTPIKVVHKFPPFKSSGEMILPFGNPLQVSALADLDRSDDNESEYVRIQRSDRNVRGYIQDPQIDYSALQEVAPFHVEPERMEVHGKEKGYIIMRHYDPEYLQSKQRYHHLGDEEDYTIQNFLNWESFRMANGPYRSRRNNYVVPRY